MRKNLAVAGAFCFAAVIAVGIGGGTSQGAQTPALLLANALIVDGSGNAPYVGDLLIEGDRVTAVGPAGSLRPRGTYAYEDLHGLALAPGFVDIHNHSTDRFARDPAATTQVAQGVTTVIVGADGGSPWPIDDYLASVEEIAPAINVGTMVGHGTLRGRAMGDDYRREATESEIAIMAEQVARAMESGAFGLSSGLEYDPGFYSSTEELIALAKVAAAAGGFYMSHTRDEEEGVMDSIAEAIRIGREGGLPVQISHIKMGNASMWDRAGEALDLIADARAEGLDVTADQYPYTAWQSGLGIVVSSRRFSDPVAVAEGLEALGGAERLQIVSYSPDRSVEGMRLSDIAAREGRSGAEQYIEMMAQGGAGVIGDERRGCRRAHAQPPRDDGQRRWHRLGTPARRRRLCAGARLLHPRARPAVDRAGRATRHHDARRPSRPHRPRPYRRRRRGRPRGLRSRHHRRQQHLHRAAADRCRGPQDLGRGTGRLGRQRRHAGTPRPSSAETVTTRSEHHPTERHDSRSTKRSSDGVPIGDLRARR